MRPVLLTLWFITLIVSCAKPPATARNEAKATRDSRYLFPKDGVFPATLSGTISQVTLDPLYGIIITVNGSRIAMVDAIGNMPPTSLIAGISLSVKVDFDYYGYYGGNLAGISFTADTATSVKQTYLAVLGRPAGPAELDHWVNGLAGGLTLTDMRRDIAFSPEAGTRIDELYRKLLKRPADSLGLFGFETFLEGGGTLLKVAERLKASLDYQRLVNSPTIYAVLGNGKLYAEPAATLPGVNAWSPVPVSGISGDILKVAYDLNDHTLVLLDGAGVVRKETAPGTGKYVAFGKAMNAVDLSIDQGHAFALIATEEGEIYCDSLISPKGWTKLGGVNRAIRVAADAGNDRVYYLTTKGTVYRVPLLAKKDDAGELIGSGAVRDIAIAPKGQLLARGPKDEFLGLSPDAKLGAKWRSYLPGRGKMLVAAHHGGGVYIMGSDGQIWRQAGTAWRLIGRGDVKTFTIAY